MKFSKKLLIGIGVTAITFFMSAQFVSAHVTVKPNQVGVGTFQTFSVGVPNEKENNPTTTVRLVIPDGLEHVSPNVKPGWQIDIKTEKVYEGMKGQILNNGNEASHTEKVTEITWSGGSVPSGQRDDFFFSAKAPVDETTLQWKAYQTYGDGTVIAWDLAPDQQPKNENGEPDFSKSGPYSTTKVVNDLKASAAPVSNHETDDTMVQGSKQSNLPIILSGLALLLAAISLGLQLKNRIKV